MPNPKRRHSRTRRDKRRTHFKAVAPQLSICPNCGSAHEAHTICPSCGYYKGQLAVSKDNIMRPENV